MRFIAAADNELGRTAADIHHQTALFGGWQAVRSAQVDQASFFAASNDFDGEAQQTLGFHDKFGGVFRHAQGVGTHHAYLFGVEATQTLAKTAHAGQGALQGFTIQGFVVLQATAQAHGVFEGIQGIQLVVYHAGNLQPEAVRPHIYGSQHVKRGLNGAQMSPLLSCQ